MKKKKNSKFIKKIIKQISSICFYIKYIFIDIRAWFRYCFTKTHYKLIKEAWCAYPYDWCYMYRVERAQLVDMLEYFKKAKITTEETYAEMIKWLNILIKLNDIILEENGVDLFHYDGHLITEELPTGKQHIVKNDGLIYHSHVHTNLKNANRFCKNECELNFVLEHSHELYQLKAKYLYHKIKETYLEIMWD